MNYYDNRNDNAVLLSKFYKRSHKVSEKSHERAKIGSLLKFIHEEPTPFPIVIQNV